MNDVHIVIGCFTFLMCAMSLAASYYEAKEKSKAQSKDIGILITPSLSNSASHRLDNPLKVWFFNSELPQPEWSTTICFINNPFPFSP